MKFLSFVRCSWCRVALSLASLLIAAECRAETVRVACPQFFEPKELTLPAGKSADLVVYLKSFGDMLGGFKIVLLTEQERKVVETSITDENGVAVFHKLAPGRYTFILDKGKQRGPESATVSVGDFYLNVSKYGN